MKCPFVRYFPLRISNFIDHRIIVSNIKKRFELSFNLKKEMKLFRFLMRMQSANNVSLQNEKKNSKKKEEEEATVCTKQKKLYTNSEKSINRVVGRHDT